MTHQIALGLDLFIPDDFGFWFAGFVDGEGCFWAYAIDRPEYKTHWLGLEIKLRADDADVLRLIHTTLKVGSITRRNYKAPDKPQVRYRVNKIRDLQSVIVPLFEQYPLRSKKARDFEIWKAAVGVASLSKQGVKLSGHLWNEYCELCKQLKQIRRF